MRYYITNNILPPEFVANRTTTFYSQFWPEPSQESNLLSGKYMPLVLPVNKADAGRFAKICETKMYSNRIQFFIKEKNLSSFASGNYHDETKDLKIMIIDFL